MAIVSLPTIPIWQRIKNNLSQAGTVLNPANIATTGRVLGRGVAAGFNATSNFLGSPLYKGAEAIGAVGGSPDAITVTASGAPSLQAMRAAKTAETAAIAAPIVAPFLTGTPLGAPKLAAPAPAVSPFIANPKLISEWANDPAHFTGEPPTSIAQRKTGAGTSTVASMLRQFGQGADYLKSPNAARAAQNQTVQDNVAPVTASPGNAPLPPGTQMAGEPGSAARNAWIQANMPDAAVDTTSVAGRQAAAMAASANANQGDWRQGLTPTEVASIARGKGIMVRPTDAYAWGQ